VSSVRPRLTYANVMATIAVFGVLAGGGAYAASKIGAKDIAKNAVRAKHIKKDAVKTKKLGNGAVTRAKVADDVLGPEVAFAEINGATGAIVDGHADGIEQADIQVPEPGTICIGPLQTTARAAGSGLQQVAGVLATEGGAQPGTTGGVTYRLGPAGACPAPTVATLVQQNPDRNVMVELLGALVEGGGK
jgi:hypothetical protein